MKKVIFVIAGCFFILFGGIFGQSLASAQSNLLSNADFENGLNNWNVGGPNWQAQSAVVYQGTISTQNTISTIPNSDYFANLYQEVPVSANQTIYATLQAKSAINVQSSARIGLLIEFVNVGNIVLASSQSETGGNTNWRQLYVSATAPVNTVKVRYHTFVYATQAETTPPSGIALGGLAYFDAAVLSLNYIAPPPPPAFIANPSFENGFVDWKQILSPSLIVDNTTATSGIYSAKSTINVGPSQDFFSSAYQDLAYQSGPVYATAKIATAINPASTGVAGLKLEFYNSFNPSGAPLGFAQSTLFGNNPWTSVVIDGGGSGVTPPVGTVMVRVLVFTYAQVGNTPANGGTANFDEVSLSYTPPPPQNRTNIINGNLENGLNSWSDQFGFPAVTSNIVHGGLLSAKKAIGVLAPPQDYYSQLYQDIYYTTGAAPYPLNTRVYASAYLKTNMNPITKSKALLQFEFIDVNGQVITNGGVPIVVSSKIGGQTDWRYVYIAAQTPAGTVRVRVSGAIFARQIDANLGGDGFYDDFVFSVNTPLPAPAPQKSLLNPGFENGLNDWDELFKPGEVSSTIKYSGNYAAVFTYDNSSLTQNYYGTATQQMLVKPGTTVYGVGFVKTNISPITPGTAGIILRFLNKVGQQVGPAYTQSIGGVTNWTLLTVTATAPTNAVRAEFGFFIYGAAGQVNPGDQAFFDQAKFR